MTYDEFIMQYPVADLILEIFSTIAPVVVAILAIIINNIKSSERDKRNKKIDMIVNYENMLIDKISELQQMLDNLHDEFLNTLECENTVSMKNAYETYELYKGKVLRCNIELYNLSFCADEILEENVNSKDISDDIKEVIKSMEAMIKMHINTMGEEDIVDRKTKEIGKIKNDIIDLKSWLTVDIKRVMEKTFKMLK